MVNPFIGVGIDILHRAKRTFVERALGALIDDGALVARKWRAVGVGFEEILPHLGTDRFKQKPQMRENGIVSQDRMARLRNVAQTKESEARSYCERSCDHPAAFRIKSQDQAEDHAACKADRQREKAGLKR